MQAPTMLKRSKAILNPGDKPTTVWRFRGCDGHIETYVDRHTAETAFAKASKNFVEWKAEQKAAAQIRDKMAEWSLEDKREAEQERIEKIYKAGGFVAPVIPNSEFNELNEDEDRAECLAEGQALIDGANLMEERMEL